MTLIRRLQLLSFGIGLLVLVGKPAIGLVSEKSRVDCVSRPPMPLHGTWKFRRHFMVRMTCLEEGTDLAGNAPGDGGVLYCGPLRDNKELKSPKLPQCLPKFFPPMAVSLKLHFLYRCYYCNVRREYKVSVTMQKIAMWLIASLRKECNELGGCHSSLPFAKCVKANVYPHVRGEVTIVTSHNENRSLTIYEDMERKMVSALKNKGNIFRMVIPKLNLVSHYHESWRSVCMQNSVGTLLFLHGLASCRGCSRSFFRDVHRERCLACPFGYYTRSTFSSHNECQRCPREREWGNRRAEMLDLCFHRN